jgi:hypothetical protein
MVGVIGMVVGAAVVSLAMQAIEPLALAINQQVYRMFPIRVPGAADLIDLYYKGFISEAQFYDAMKANGLDYEYAKNLYDSQVQIFNAADSVTAWRRGIIDEDTLYTNLHKLRYTQEDIDRVISLTEYYPNPSDLVRFAVREVYSPQIAQQYGLFEDFPEEFIQAAAKAGLPEEQAKNYWGAHWELPSISQAFEMYHRRIINEEELNTLLRSQDVMPYWRERLTSMAYSPLTRVDVRRMYGLGVLDRDGVYNAYLDHGYSPENAELMTNFTIKYETNEDFGITRSTVLKSYKKGLITQDQAVSYLAQLGYAENTIELHMQQTEYDMYEEDAELYVDNLVLLYRLGAMTIDQLKTSLLSLDLPGAYVDKIVNKEKVSTSKKLKLPTKTELEKWLELKIINETEYSNAMTRLGYQEEDIIKYLQAYTMLEDTSKKEYMTVAIYQRWLKAGIMSTSTFRETLTEMNVSESDIERLIQEAQQANG